jgi:RHS repeat-associated protein
MKTFRTDFHIAVMISLVLLSASFAFAQFDASTSVGAPSAILHGTDLDTVDTMSGNLQIKLPLLHLPGRGLDTDFQMTVNSKVWDLELYYDGMGNVGVQANPNFAARSLGIAGMGAYSGPGAVCLLYGDGDTCAEVVYYYTWNNNNGNRTTMANKDGILTGYFIPSGYWSFDDSYLYADTFTSYSGVLPTVLKYKNGLTYSYDSSGNQSLTDTNGNLISCAAPSGIMSCTDTLGRVITYTPGTSVSYKDSSGTTQTISFTTTPYTLEYPPSDVPSWYALPCHCGGPGTGTSNLITKVTLPNNLSYEIQYVMNSDGTTTGEIAKIILPTGGYIRYVYGLLNIYPSAPYGTHNVIKRIVSPDGTSGSEQTWNYNYAYTTTGAASFYTTTITKPTLESEIITYTQNNYDSSSSVPFPTQTIYKDVSGTAIKTVNQTVGSDNSSYIDPQTFGLSGANFNNVRPLSTTTVLNDTTQQSEITYSYGSFGNVNQKNEYDWGASSPFRYTTSSYLHDVHSAYAATGVHILDRLYDQSVYNASSSLISETTNYYDLTTPSSTSGVVSHDYTNYPSTYNLRGNLTQKSRWLNTTSTWLSSTNKYNDVGNLLSTTDPLSNVTSYDYTDNYYSYSPASPTSAFVTTITKPSTSGVSHIDRVQYYFYSGLMAAQCGENFPSATSCAYGLSSQPDYASMSYDEINRPLCENFGDGGQTCLTYNESSLPISISTSTKILSSTNLTRASVYDGLGRISQTQLTSDPAGTDFVDITYDLLGRKYTVTNPHRSGSSPTDGTTTYSYDALSRIISVSEPDGSIVGTSYSGNCTTVTDEASKKRASYTDAAGRITQVLEDPSGSSYETDYIYDELDNLTTVTQKGGTSSTYWRIRTFGYDSLSRLTSASNPESGTASYTYDANGNVATKVAPQANQSGTSTTTTTYSYDALNRLTLKTYSDGSPEVGYVYDLAAAWGSTLAYPIGRLGGVYTWISAIGFMTAENYSFDQMGRIALFSYCIPTECRTSITHPLPFTYAYYLDGSVKSLTYPSGRVVSYAENNAQQMMAAQDTANSINYATSAVYAPQGALASVQNGANLVSTQFYNSRLQPCRISVKTSGTAPSSCTDLSHSGNVLDYTYSFDLSSVNTPCSTGFGTPTNNADVASITNNITSSRSQNFCYDSFNRLAKAQTTSTDSTSSTNCWSESYSIDPWGNLTNIAQPSGSSPYVGCMQESGSSIAVNSSNQDTGSCYDAAGNKLGAAASSPPYCSPLPTTYAYNAENQLTSTAGVSYTYDGNGKRAGKSSGTLYWYGTNPDPLLETDGSGNLINEYIFLNGKRIARRDSSGNVDYYFADHLGTTRVVTNASGTIQDDSDYYPYGSQRVISSASGNTYKFSSKERDSESGLDDFGARYYSSQYGRFMTSDEFKGGIVDPFTGQDIETNSALPYADITDPQTLNKYAYVRNNPLRYVDPDGHDLICISCLIEALSTPQARQVGGGVAKIGLGVGLVATAAGGDAPGGVAGTLLIANAAFGGAVTAVSGTVDVMGAATHTEVKPATDALEATGNLPGLVTLAATGNIQAGQTVTTLADAASLVAAPREAVKNVATMADTYRTVIAVRSLLHDAVSSARGLISNPQPPSMPKPPPPPECGGNKCSNEFLGSFVP